MCCLVSLESRDSSSAELAIALAAAQRSSPDSSRDDCEAPVNLCVGLLLNSYMRLSMKRIRIFLLLVATFPIVVSAQVGDLSQIPKLGDVRSIASFAEGEETYVAV